MEHDLYGACAPGLVERLRSVPAAVESVMLIGHNPALHELALDLACRSLTADELASKYPTAALAIFELSAWDELEHSTAELTALVRPRDLE